MKKWTLICLIFLSCPSCVLDTEMKADALRYKAIAPDHRRYIESDPTLTAQQKQDRYDLLLAWKNSFPEGYLK